MPVVTSDPAEMPYRTEHFRIYYDSADFDRSAIEEIGLLKERMFTHVTEYLGTSFNLVITAIITDTIGRSHMDWTAMQTHEQTIYARFDNGHETAHVISIHEWQRSDLNFLIEGIAMAAQHNPSGDAIDAFVRMISADPNREGRLSSATTVIANNISGRTFDYSYEQYIQAGAFVHYLKITYGLDKFTAWWKLTTSISGPSDDAGFGSVFNTQLPTAIAEFTQVVHNRFPGS